MVADLHQESAGDVLRRSASRGLAVLLAVRPTEGDHLIRRSPKPCRRRSPRPASCWSGLRGGRRSSTPSGTIRLRGSHPWLPDCQLSAFPRMGKQSCIPSVERWSGSGSRYGSPSPDWSFRLSSRAIGTRSSTPRSSDLARYRRPPSGTCRSAVSPRRRPCSDHE